MDDFPESFEDFYEEEEIPLHDYAFSEGILMEVYDQTELNIFVEEERSIYNGVKLSLVDKPSLFINALFYNTSNNLN